MAAPSSSPSFASTLTASILANLVVSHVVVHLMGQQSESLRAYYADVKMIAVGLDVTSVLWGTLLAQRLAHGYRAQLVAAVVIQLVHDAVFGAWLRSTTRFASSPVLLLFRRYAAEHGAWILAVDAAIMMTAGTFAHLLDRTVRDVPLVGALALYTHLLLLDTL